MDQDSCLTYVVEFIQEINNLATIEISKTKTDTNEIKFAADVATKKILTSIAKRGVLLYFNF